MAFRYIQKKPCKFEGCPNMPKMGAGGYCYEHEEHDPGFKRKQLKLAVKKDEKKIKMLINGNDSKLVQNTAATLFQLQENWFYEAAKELSKNPVCMECKAFIPSSFYRAATAHILPKRKEYGFPSVATHSLNRLFLGAGCGCHNIYDDTWEGASKMKIWPLVIIAFVEMYPDIDPGEYKNIPDILRPYIPKF